MSPLVRQTCVSALLNVFAALGWAQRPPAVAALPVAAPSVPAISTNSAFPVRRVALYKNGVGYFEHLGQVHGSEEVSIRFTSGQLNDVLKSLTVFDLAGGRIAGVNYGSAAPLERRLDDLHLPSGPTTTMTEFLGSLRGARLEVRNGAGSTASVVVGRLLSVERKTRMGSGATLEVDYLSMITDNGEVRTAEVTPSFSVRILDHDLRGKVDRYMEALASAKDADLRRMVISTVGNGSRNLFVSYISEVPVWKTTYRLVLGGQKHAKPLLQGWAIIDNTVGEDWENVELTLLAGAPVSFVQRLSQPYYVRRPEIGLAQGFTPAPQTHEAVLSYGSNQITGTVSDAAGAVIASASVRIYAAGNVLVGETRSGPQGRFTVGALPDGIDRVEILSPGFQKMVLEGAAANSRRSLDVRLQVGSVSQTVNVTAEEYALKTESATLTANSRALGSGSALGGSGQSLPLLSRDSRGTMANAETIAEARTQLEAAASAENLGDLFEYRIKEPITIRKDQSALVPILQAAVEAEKVSVWNPNSAPSKPLHALWLNNTSGATLDGGTFSVLDNETFAGEGVIDQVRPGERRLISYAVDLALNAASRREVTGRRVTRFKAAKGTLTLYSDLRESTTYTLRNEDTTPRIAIIEHPVRAGYTLRGDVNPAEVTREWQRFRLEVGPKQTAKLMLEEARPIEQTYRIGNLNADEIAVFVRDRQVSPEFQAAMDRLFLQRQVVADLEAKSEAVEKEKTRIYDDQQRLRENLKSLKGTSEEKALVQRYTQQLNQQEDRLAKIDTSLEALQKEKDEADNRLEEMVQALDLGGAV